MPITVVVSGPIPGHIVPNAGQRSTAQDVIAMLQYADIWNGPGTLRQQGGVRLDMQGTIPATPALPARQNLQVQIGGHSIAHADVATSIMDDDPANQRGALNKVISALNQSLNGQMSYLVRGSIP
jgi:hypothetical protein